jgi:hypothetical protein
LTPAQKRYFSLLILVVLGTVVTLFWFTHRTLPWESGPPQQDPQTRELLARRARLDAREQEADRTVWAKEMLAQNCGRTIEILWDSVNATSNKLQRIAEFPLHEVVLPNWPTTQHLPHGIELREGIGPGGTLPSGQWREWVEGFARAGWQLENIEFRHNRFDTDTNGQPWQSHFYFAARLTRTEPTERAMLEGDLVVDWAAKSPGEASPAVARVDASHLKLTSRIGEPFFEKILQETITPANKTGIIDPLILYDLDGDGLSEIILASKNLVYYRHGPDRYEGQSLCRYPIDFVTSSLIADFDGDGFADLLCANGRGLFLFKGSPHGTFDEPARLVWAANPPLKNAMVMTCGDIDEDGALDIFLGQYKVPTLGQVLRPHYYDANDGWPSYLLRNDGHGNFSDVTGTSGLGSKRWRRTYTASLVDLDGDGHLDLAVVSDFAGLDLYRNDGQGRFTEVTRQWVAEPHAFGMAHALADFNADGRLDLLMIGMPSPTVDRLEHLDLHRPYSAEDPLRRPAMTFGNRLFLARTNGGFEQTALGDSIARSGWSWGCSAFDLDNDGFPDVYLANGLQSGHSVRDYESEFWLHDIFIDESIDDVIATHYLEQKLIRTRGSGWSYGGYEKNRLFLNQRGAKFIEIGHLAGVALEQDSRNVVADDLDGDGRVDLLVTTFEVWPEPKQTLQVYKNKITDGGHWIGFRFREQARERSPVGARVTIYYSGRSAVRQIVTGDSHRSQHSNTIHFGIGEADRVDRAEIRWINGRTIILRQPAVDQYQDVSVPAPK